MSLESDILWPSDKSGQISSWLDITSDSEVSWGLLEKRILLSLGDLGGFGTLLKFSLSLKNESVKLITITHHDLLLLIYISDIYLSNQRDTSTKFRKGQMT